jgi:hypothetical protein
MLFEVQLGVLCVFVAKSGRTIWDMLVLYIFILQILTCKYGTHGTDEEINSLSSGICAL